MPIKAISGVPGAGKTLLALELALQELGVKDRSSPEAIIKQLGEAKRPLAVCGVEGLRPGIFTEIDSPMDWQDLPDGTLVVVDEAWKWWGKHLAHIRTDERYLKLAEHRHRGFDFILTFQNPAQLQDHVRGLVGEHHHVTRKFGTNLTVRYEWPCLQESPNSLSIKKQAIETTWKHPKGLYDLYKSATQHTIKRKIPKKLLAIPLILFAVALTVPFVVKKLATIGEDVVPGARAAEGEHDTGTKAKRDKNEPMSREEWVQRFVPLVAEMPMSAPAFHDREVVAHPRIACMIGERVGCICKTDQGTEWKVHDKTCRNLVAQGGTYDYFREPDAERQGDRAGEPSAPEAQPAADSNNPTSAEQVASYGQFRQGGLAATP